jgi:hypothetical protein
MEIDGDHPLHVLPTSCTRRTDRLGVASARRTRDSPGRNRCAARRSCGTAARLCGRKVTPCYLRQYGGDARRQMPDFAARRRRQSCRRCREAADRNAPGPPVAEARRLAALARPSDALSPLSASSQWRGRRPPGGCARRVVAAAHRASMATTAMISATTRSEVAYAAVGPMRRQRLHLQVAQALEPACGATNKVAHRRPYRQAWRQGSDFYPHAA